MTTTAISGFYAAVDEFARSCLSVGEGLEAPSVSREEMTEACDSLAGLDTELLLDATVNATGYNCASELGDAPFRGFDVTTALASVEESYREERIRAAALVEGAARCGSAVDDVVRTSSTSISSCLDTGSELLGMLGAMVSTSIDEVFSSALVEAGSELIELCLSYSETEIADRDECVEGAFDQFVSDCECHCTTNTVPTPAPNPVPEPAPTQVPEPAVDPVAVAPPPPELAEVPEPTPPPKKLQVQAELNNEAGQW